MTDQTNLQNIMRFLRHRAIDEESVASLSPEESKIILNVLDRLQDSYVISKDGDSWCAVGPGFINLQESEATFGDTPWEAFDEFFTPKEDKMQSKTNMEEVTLDLSDQDILILAKMAHEQNITLNQLCNNILRNEMEKEEVAFLKYRMSLYEEYKPIALKEWNENQTIRQNNYIHWLEQKLFSNNVPIKE